MEIKEQYFGVARKTKISKVKKNGNWNQFSSNSNGLFFCCTPAEFFGIEDPLLCQLFELVDHRLDRLLAVDLVVASAHVQGAVAAFLLADN